MTSDAKAGGGHGRSFLSDTAVYGLSTVIGQLTPIFLVPVYARMLAPADLGLLAVSASMLALAVPIAVMGLDSAGGRYYWQTDGRERDRLLRTWFWTQLCSSLLVVVILALMAVPLANILDRTASLQILLVATAIVPFRAVAVFLNNLFRARRQAKLSLAFNFVLASMTLVFTLVFLFVFRHGVLSVLEGQWLALAIAVLAWSRQLRGVAAPLIDLAVLRRLLAYSLPLVPAALFGWLSSYSDRWLLGTTLGLEDAGTYQIGVYAAMAMGLGVAAFGQAWGPFVFQGEGRDGHPLLLRRIALVAVIIASLGAFLLAAWADPIVNLFAGAAYGSAAPVVAILALSQVSVLLLVLGAAQCNLAHDNRPYLMAAIIAAVVSLSLNLLLLPRAGVLGAAYANLGAQASAAIFLLARSRRLYDLGYQHAGMATSMALAGAAITGVLWYQSHYPTNWWYGTLALSVLACAVAFVAARSHWRYWDA